MAFTEFRRNIAYARDLVRGGQHLDHLQVGAFDIADLYRAAWVQAVAALDQWVHSELYERAVLFALNTDLPRPARFLNLEIPMRMFEDVHHHGRAMREAFDSHLRDQFGYQSFQNPEKIRLALRHVSDVPLWPEVAKRITAETGRGTTHNEVQQLLADIAQRRNRIAHEADRDPELVHDKQEMTARAASAAIDDIERIVGAILHVIGRPPAETDQPEDKAGQQRTSSGSNRNDLYRQFWSKFRPIVLQHGWSTAAAPEDNWWNLPSGTTGVTWGLAFTRFGCRSELALESSDAAVNLARWHALAARRDEITAGFGDELIFDDLRNRKACRIETRLLGPSITDQERWPDILLWMEDTQLRLRAAIDAVGGVPKS